MSTILYKYQKHSILVAAVYLFNIVFVLCRWFGLRVDIVSSLLTVLMTFSSIALSGCEFYKHNTVLHVGCKHLPSLLDSHNYV